VKFAKCNSDLSFVFAQEHQHSVIARKDYGLFHQPVWRLADVMNMHMWLRCILCMQVLLVAGCDFTVVGRPVLRLACCVCSPHHQPCVSYLLASQMYINQYWLMYNLCKNICSTNTVAAVVMNAMNYLHLLSAVSLSIELHTYWHHFIPADLR